MFGHVALATAMQNGVWQLSEPEADGYTDALAEFMRWHGGIALKGRMGSKLALIGTMGMIYLPRIKYVIDEKRRRHNGGPTLNDTGAPVQ